MLSVMARSDRFFGFLIPSACVFEILGMLRFRIANILLFLLLGLIDCPKILCS